ncbi:MAG: hypothetical protein GEU73_16185 [Chloroflexi bacterium]|nr:hypothetical protein [Chloroflexota bacterium]
MRRTLDLLGNACMTDRDLLQAANHVDRAIELLEDQSDLTTLPSTFITRITAGVDLSMTEVTGGLPASTTIELGGRARTIAREIGQPVAEMFVLFLTSANLATLGELGTARLGGRSAEPDGLA